MSSNLLFFKAMVRMRFHKNAIAAVITVTFSVILQVVAAQDGPPAHRIRAVIADLRNAHQAHEVDLALRAVPGVRMSRTDFNTRNLFMEVSADCVIDRAQVEALLQPHGLDVRCWSRTLRTAQDPGPLDPRTCAEPPIER